MKHTLAGVAARSGGHILPCLTLLEQEKTPTTQVLFFTSHTNLDTSIAKNYPWITTKVALNFENVPYKKPWLLPFFAVQFFVSFFKSFYYLAKHKPSKLVSTGGYVSIPVCLAARLLRIPVELFELNVIPGRAATLLAPLSSTVFTCFNDAHKYFKTAQLKEYPLRFSNTSVSKQQALEQLAYTPEKKTLLILGGSQGSAFLNAQLCNTLSAFSKNTLQVIHQAGNNDIEALTAFYKAADIPAHVFAYEQDLAPYYQAADVVVCRAGAGTLFETAFFKKKCIVIPLEIASTTHQVDNAYAMQKQHPELFTVVRQTDLQEDASLLFKALSH